MVEFDIKTVSLLNEFFISIKMESSREICNLNDRHCGCNSSQQCMRISLRAEGHKKIATLAVHESPAPKAFLGVTVLSFPENAFTFGARTTTKLIISMIN